MTAAITIVVNGERRQIEVGTTLLTLLNGLNLEPKMVVVELNRAIVKRGTLASTLLHNDDEVELVHLVGGG